MIQLGVFRLGNMLLGLPAAHLREVVPYAGLCALPCESPLVLGGINVRGGIIPTMDLNLALGRPAASDNQLVLIMSYQGRVLGMLADSAVGIVETPDVHAREHPESGSRILLESFTPAEDAEAVHLLSLEYLFSLPGMPEVADTREAEMHARELPAAEPAEDSRSVEGVRHMMVVRCGGLVMALDSTYVHSTVPCPDLLSSALSGDYCEGAIAFEGRQIAAVDLMRFLGFSREHHASVQAFVVEMASGMVACLVEEIVDVVKMQLPTALPVPRFALPRPEFVSGMHPEAVITAHETIRAKCSHAAYLFELCGEAIQHSEALEGLARMNVGHAGGTEAPRNSLRMDVRSMGSCQVVCYDLGYEVATPMTQITEILPWQAGMQIFGAGQRPDGIVVSRGHVIPTYELCPLLGEPAVRLGSGASILVVESEGANGLNHYVGFVVPQLLSIDQAMWPQGHRPGDESGTQAASAGSLLGGLGSSSEPVRVGEPDNFRLVCMVDLQMLAKRLCKARFNEPAAAQAVFTR